MENTNSHGSIRISDEVIADIAIRAAREVEGVAGVTQGVWDSAKNLISSKTNMIKGINVSLTEGDLELTAQISVLFGCRIPDVSAAVQQAVAEAVTDMTGIPVRAVNVSVVGVVPEKEAAKETKKK